jgi:DNA-directed RNA polymerase subunit L
MIVFALIIAVSVVGYIIRHPSQEPPQPIGKFNDVKMDETIDNDADRGISSSDRQ